MSKEPEPRFTFGWVTRMAGRLAELHGVSRAEVYSFVFSMLGHCAGPAVRFEGRKGDAGWPFLLVTPSDEEPPWYTLLMDWPRHLQDGFTREIASIMRTLTVPETVESLRARVTHLRSFGDAFAQEVRFTEHQLALIDKPTAFKFLHFPRQDGTTMPREAAAEGLSVVVDGDRDMAALWKARANSRALVHLLRQPQPARPMAPWKVHPGEPRGQRVAGRCSEKRAVKLVRGTHPMRLTPPPVMLPVSAGHKSEGCFSALLNSWDMSLRSLMGRRFTLHPWIFRPASTIRERVEEEEAKLAEGLVRLSDAAVSHSTQLERMAGKIVAIAHAMEAVGGESSFDHGNEALTELALKVAGEIHHRAVHWINQVLPGHFTGITAEDAHVMDYIRRFAPLDELELLRRYTGLKAHDRDEALARLTEAGFVERDEAGKIRAVY